MSRQVRFMAVLAASAVALLTACGQQGPLEPPGAAPPAPPAAAAPDPTSEGTPVPPAPEPEESAEAPAPPPPVAEPAPPAQPQVPSVTPVALVTIRGQASYRERMALPPGSTLEVELVRVGEADAPPVAIREKNIEGQVPVYFEIDYDPTKLAEGDSYAIRARIMNGDDVLFVTAEPMALVTDERAGPMDLLLRRAPAEE